MILASRLSTENDVAAAVGQPGGRDVADQVLDVRRDGPGSLD
jgi:hypothetical protein